MHTDATLARTARHAPRIRKQPGEKLRAALIQLAGGLGEVRRHTERNWASITFAGTRHGFTLAFDGAEAVEAAEHFVAQLPDHEFSIAGQLVADAAIIEVDHRLCPPQMLVSCELLLLDEG